MNPKLVQLSSGDWIIPAQVIRIQLDHRDVWKSVEQVHHRDYYVKAVCRHGETVSLSCGNDLAKAQALRDEIARLRNGE